MKKNILVRSILFTVLCGLIIGISGCEKETILIDKITDNQFNQLVQEYDLTYETITPSKSKEMTITDKTVSISELEFVLASLQKLKKSTFSIENEISPEFPAPRLRSSEPENNENVNTACVSGHNDELTATVCLDFKNGTVTNSSVSFRLPSSLYLNYVHDGGYYSKNGNIVNFSAYGRVQVFVAIHDVIITSYSVSMRGYYDLSSNRGELTFY